MGKGLVNGFSIDLLAGGNSNIFGIFTPKFGEDEPILTKYFFHMGGLFNLQLYSLLFFILLLLELRALEPETWGASLDFFCGTSMFVYSWSSHGPKGRKAPPIAHVKKTQTKSRNQGLYQRPGC